MIISAIAAIGQKNEIGCDNKLIWQLQEDLTIFKNLTVNHHVLMGRMTYESIGKPLPKRFNIILSRTQQEQKTDSLQFCPSLEEGIALAKSRGEKELFICGGSKVYEEAIKICSKLYITFIQASAANADAFFPQIKSEQWLCIEERTSVKSEPKFVFRVFARA